MPVQVSYPGVYIDEIQSGSRAIAGVPTSVAAFVGYTSRGPTNDPIQIFSYADYERNFGGFDLDSPLSYAVNHFFLNGGAVAWIVRVADGAQTASVTIDALNGNPSLLVEAAADGAWANAVVLAVDYATSNPGTTFNLTVSQIEERNGRLFAARSETHRNLSMNSASSNYAVSAIESDSEMIRLTDLGLPGVVASVTSGIITDAVVAGLGPTTRRLAVSIDGDPPIEFDLFGDGEANPLADVASLVALLTAEQAGLGLTFGAIAGPGAGEFQLTVTGGSDRTSSVSFRTASRNSATAALRLGTAFGARETDGSSDARPAPTGTTGTAADPSSVAAGDQIVVELRDASGVLIDDATVVEFDAVPGSLAEARTIIEAALRSSTVAAISTATVAVLEDSLVLTPGGDIGSRNFTFVAGGGGDAATPLGLIGAVENVARYEMGDGPLTLFQSAVSPGDDGSVPAANLVSGTRAQKSGLYALEDVSLFNILNLPGISDVPALTEAIAYAEERRSMVLIDLDPNIDTLDDARDWVNDPANSGLKHRNAVAYFPQVMLADPLQNGRLQSFPNSGVMAGLWARTDAQRGVWKAPAGIEARLRGVQALDYVLSDPENGVLNPLGLNCLRTFPVFGTVSWGARTLVGADAFASEWKYVPVRRIALFIEESLYRGTQFVVFEPNDEPLWAQVRLSVGSFMNNLFRQGAFQGMTPQQAYFVRCDSTTTTQADIDLGIVNIQVGFAPLKPAEFVILQIQQIAGQSQT